MKGKGSRKPDSGRGRTEVSTQGLQLMKKTCQSEISDFPRYRAFQAHYTLRNYYKITADTRQLQMNLNFKTLSTLKDNPGHNTSAWQTALLVSLLAPILTHIQQTENMQPSPSARPATTSRGQKNSARFKRRQGSLPSRLNSASTATQGILYSFPNAAI